MGRQLNREDIETILGAARDRGSVTVALRIWTDAERIVVSAPGTDPMRYAVSVRRFSDDPVWNPPAKTSEQEMTEDELVEYLLGRSLEIEFVSVGRETLIEG